MKITLDKLVDGIGTLTDLSKNIDETANITITNERERTEFERVVEDIHLNISNLHDEQTNFLSDVNATTRLRIEMIEDDRKIFVGYMNNKSLSFDVKQRWMSFDAFASYKLFWERAESTRIFNRVFSRTVYDTIERILKFNFFQDYRFSDLITGIDIRGDLATKKIRSDVFSSDPEIGNNGRYTDLDSNTTVAELMKAIALYHNAEYFIDNENGKLVMQRRFDIVDDIQHNLDNIMRDDKQVEVKSFGTKKYDFLYAPFRVPKPKSVVFLRMIGGTKGGPNPSFQSRLFTYYVTYIINDIETEPSDPFTIEIPAIIRSAPDDVTFANPVFYLPLGPSGVTERRVYRNHVIFTVIELIDTPEPQLQFQVRNNTTTTIIDSSVFYKDTFLVTSRPSVNVGAWFSYNESNETWNEPILDLIGGDNTPSGEIFNILPQLRFRSPNDPNTLLNYNIIDIFAFFGKENSFEEIRSNWLDLLRTKSLIIAPVTGRNYIVGDSVINSQKIFPNVRPRTDKFVIKKAVIDPIKNESELELIPV